MVWSNLWHAGELRVKGDMGLTFTVLKWAVGPGQEENNKHRKEHFRRVLEEKVMWEVQFLLRRLKVYIFMTM